MTPNDCGPAEAYDTSLPRVVTTWYQSHTSESTGSIVTTCWELQTLGMAHFWNMQVARWASCFNSPEAMADPVRAFQTNVGSQ